MVMCQHIQPIALMTDEVESNNVAIFTHISHKIETLLLESKRKFTEKKVIGKTAKVPLWEKYTLSIDEAAEYFGIGQNRLRSIVASNPSAEYLITVGAKTLIKRKAYEKYIDEAAVM